MQIRLCSSRLLVAKWHLHASRSVLALHASMAARRPLCVRDGMRWDGGVDGLTFECRVLMAGDVLRSASMAKGW